MFLRTASSPHIHKPNSVSQIMTWVLVAMLPGIGSAIWFFGWGVVINIITAITIAMAAEAVILRLRQRPIKASLNDGSAIVTATLLAVCLPPLTEWWIVAIGTLFAIVFAKHLYGGLGQNPFNPAMVGYAVLLISFPADMTLWIAPDIGNNVYKLGFFETAAFFFAGHLPAGLTMDALTQATPLDAIKTQLGLNFTISETKASSAIIFGDIAGKGWEWIGNWWLLGGILLIYRRIITWHIPVSMVGSLFAISFIFYVIDPDTYSSPLFHIFAGATLLGAFFIATDPVSAATTPKGKILFGAGIGLLIYIIRVWGGYPDAVAFAVLLMNMAAPTIDYYTRPRVYGYPKKGEEE